MARAPRRDVVSSLEVGEICSQAPAHTRGERAPAAMLRPLLLLACSLRGARASEEFYFQVDNYAQVYFNGDLLYQVVNAASTTARSSEEQPLGRRRARDQGLGRRLVGRARRDPRAPRRDREPSRWKCERSRRPQAEASASRGGRAVLARLRRQRVAERGHAGRRRLRVPRRRAHATWRGRGDADDDATVDTLRDARRLEREVGRRAPTTPSCADTPCARPTRPAGPTTAGTATARSTARWPRVRSTARCRAIRASMYCARARIGGLRARDAAHPPPHVARARSHVSLAKLTPSPPPPSPGARPSIRARGADNNLLMASDDDTSSANAVGFDLRARDLAAAGRRVRPARRARARAPRARRRRRPHRRHARHGAQRVLEVLGEVDEGEAAARLQRCSWCVRSRSPTAAAARSSNWEQARRAGSTDEFQARRQSGLLPPRQTAAGTEQGDRLPRASAPGEAQADATSYYCGPRSSYGELDGGDYEDRRADMLQTPPFAIPAGGSDARLGLGRARWDVEDRAARRTTGHAGGLQAHHRLQPCVVLWDAAAVFVLDTRRRAALGAADRRRRRARRPDRRQVPAAQLVRRDGQRARRERHVRRALVGRRVGDRRQPVAGWRARARRSPRGPAAPCASAGCSSRTRPPARTASGSTTCSRARGETLFEDSADTMCATARSSTATTRSRSSRTTRASTTRRRRGRSARRPRPSS